VPVGTGVLIAGGNYNLVRDNDIYDNWRNGVMWFWVPGAIRGDLDVAAQIDTSNHNRAVGNRMGFHPAGVIQPNALDFWWDDQGLGNCWEANTSASGEITHNALVPLLPDCTIGSLLPAGNALKSASLLPCSEFNRASNPAPPGCDWLTSPAAPAGRQPAPGEESAAEPPASPPEPGTAREAGQGDESGRALPATGSAPPLAIVVGLGLVAFAVQHARRRSRTEP
jgi:hypothetical protein